MKGITDLLIFFKEIGLVSNYALRYFYSNYYQS